MDQPKSPVSRNGQNGFPVKAKLENVSSRGQKKANRKFLLDSIWNYCTIWHRIFFSGSITGINYVRSRNVLVNLCWVIQTIST